MKKQIKYISAGMLAGMLLCGGELQASNRMTEMHVCLADAIQKDNRPEISNRLFRSNAVEKEILRVQKLLKNAKLAWSLPTVSRIHWIQPYISVREAMANRIRSYIRAIFTPCGFATPVHRYGLTCN